jgi:hypothetical protein
MWVRVLLRPFGWSTPRGEIAGNAIYRKRLPGCLAVQVNEYFSEQESKWIFLWC